MQTEKRPTIKDNLLLLIDNKEYWLICFSLTGLFFVVTGIQYWLPSYLKSVYNLTEDQAAVFYTTTSITAPIAGVIIGGIVTSALGGYNTYKAHRLQQVLGCMAVISAAPIPFVDFSVFAVLIWFVLFFGGCVLPQVTGIMLNTVEETKRSSANSIAVLCYNLFGYLPAPSFYGFASALANSKDEKGEMRSDSRVPMGCLLYSTFFSITFLVVGINSKLKKEKLKDGMNLYGTTGETMPTGRNESEMIARS